MNRQLYKFAATVFVLISVVRVVSTYRHTSQLFDEPCHVAASIELLDRHTYYLDPIHPPLARFAIGIPLYLAGERYPRMGPEEAGADYNVVGNHVLYDSGHYLRNLMLARSGMLPFLIVLSALVFLWTCRDFGPLAALFAVALLTTTPMVLAFSSIAYTDLVTATTQFAALFAFTRWLERPSNRLTLILGLAVGLALMKMTSFVFLPGAALALLLCRKLCSSETDTRIRWKKLTAAVAMGLILLWASYGFSFGHVREEFGLSVNSMPSFQHFPGPLRTLARTMVVDNWRIPAPALLRGFAEIWVLNKSAASAYMFGSRADCWFFFLAAVFFKAPIPLLILFGAGLFFIFRFRRELSWNAFAPAICVAAIFLVTLPVKYHAGTRHVLVVFPLIAVVAGAGASYLLRTRGATQKWAGLSLVVLLTWQGFETVRAQKDFISYFSEFAGRDPSRVMVIGCDLDCGQDIFRLADELRARGISHFGLAVWSSADMQRMGLPSFDVLQPNAPATGWIAISARSQLLGEVLHEGYGPDAYRWLRNYRPEAQIGQTIRLYYIPPP